jgi:hypothetical protein
LRVPALRGGFFVAAGNVILSKEAFMARDDKGKIRVIMIDLEGSNETLQEGLRTAASMMRPVPPPRAVLPAQPNLPSNGTPQLELPLDGEYTEAEPVAAEKPNKPKRARAAPIPDVIEIDLTSGDMPFAAFCQAKSPSKEIDKALVLAGWLKQYRQVEAVSPEHIYTCYRIVGWSVPNDITGPFRNGKRQGKFKSVGNGMYAITLIGENELQKMNGG